MSNRYTNPWQHTFERQKIELEIVFDGNTTSNPILKAWNPTTHAYVTAGASGYRGVKSVTRTGVGIYRIDLQDRYQRLLSFNFACYAIDETNAPVTGDAYVKIQTFNAATAPSLSIVTYGNAIATPVELDVNTRCYVNVSFSNSTAL
jgi:hypothetical protein